MPRHNFLHYLLECDSSMDFGSTDDIEKPEIHRTSSGHCKDSIGRQGGRGFSSCQVKHARCSLVRLFRLLDVQAWRTNRQFISRSRMRQTTAEVSCSIMTPQRPVAAGDAHLSEAIEDCIKFLNSSSKRSC